MSQVGFPTGATLYYAQAVLIFIFLCFSGVLPFGSDINVGTFTDVSLGYKVSGPTGLMFGSTVAGIGDINGDSFDDFAIGSHNYTYLSRTYCGMTHVIFGKAGNRNDINISKSFTQNVDGFRIYGATAREGNGFAISSAGDINDDGIGDMMTSSPFYNNNNGVVYIIFGKRLFNFDIDLSVTDLAATHLGFRVIGVDGCRAGYSVSNAGDFNGDGISDIVIGFPFFSYLRSLQGIAGVLYGKHVVAPDYFTDYDTASISLGPNIAIVIGKRAGHNAGTVVAGNFDLNDDGLSDFMMGMPYWGETITHQGAVYVAFGKMLLPGINYFTDLYQTADFSYGFVVSGKTADDYTGRALSPAGDFNEDGIDDIAIGVALGQGNAYGGTDAGVGYILFGSTSSFTSITLSDPMPAATGKIVRNYQPFAEFGTSVACVGDINDDGKSDVVFGAPLDDANTKSNSGSAFVLYGFSGGGDAQVNTEDLSSTSDRFIISGKTEDDQLGTSVSGIGDVNGDGGADMAVITAYKKGHALVYIVYGLAPPTKFPTSQPSAQPTQPTGQPSHHPSSQPSRQPTWQPTSQPSRQPTSQPSRQPSSQPSRQPTSQPTGQPSRQPSSQPSIQPSRQPSSQPSRQPSAQPSSQPTSQPSMQPSRQPTSQPSGQPTSRPTTQPSRQPSRQPTSQPSRQPTSQPSEQPTARPTTQPTRQPSTQPTSQPTNRPTSQPSGQPSSAPTTQPSRQPTTQPSGQPSSAPSSQPSSQPSRQPSSQPSRQPSAQPSSQPTSQPSSQPSRQPTSQPSGQPTSRPTTQPSSQPSRQPSSQPTAQPSSQPSNQPTNQPSSLPTAQPTSQPTHQPSSQPTAQPSNQPSRQPSAQPTTQPSSQPSVQPSRQPTSQPSRQPTSQPTGQPSRQPSSQPSNQPSRQPSSQPTLQPSSQPSSQPTSQPSIQPSRQPTSQPSEQPTSRPTMQPSSQPSNQPSSQPTSQPSSQPSGQPSNQPSNQPTTQPTSQPTSQPTCQPSAQPSSQPSSRPTMQPTMQPSTQPTVVPTVQPSAQPSVQPSAQPTSEPTGQPTMQPTMQPTCQPSCTPSSQPSTQPTGEPTSQPSAQPTIQPTVQPSMQPSAQPSSQPSSKPTLQPTSQPSAQPSQQPTSEPSSQPTTQPSGQPSSEPSLQPSTQPTSQPTMQPTGQPTGQPTRQPTRVPSGQPTVAPSSQPSMQPTAQPSVTPSSQPTAQPSSVPSSQPSSCPSGQPSSQPTSYPSSQPSVQPSASPTTQPSSFPSSSPSTQPSSVPSTQPTSVPSYSPSYKKPYPAPKIISIALDAVTRLSFNIRVRISGVDNARVYCGAFSLYAGSHYELTSLFEVSSQNRYRYTSNSYAVIPFEGMDPSTKYSVYCFTQSLDDSRMPLIDVQSKETIASTLCCKALAVSLAQSSMYEGSTALNVLALTLRTPPGLALNVSLQFLQTSSSTAGDGSGGIVATNAMPSLLSFSNRDAAGKTVKTTVVAGTPGVYSLLVRINGSSASEFALEVMDSVSLRVLAIGAEPPTPQLRSAQFSDTGSMVYVLFDSPTNKGGFDVTAPCSSLLVFPSVQSAKCQWKDAATLLVYPVYSSLRSASMEGFLEPGSNITLKPNVVKAQCLLTDKSACGVWNFVAPRSVVAMSPSHPVTPAVSIVAPSRVARCQDVPFDLTGTTGSGGRPWASVAYAVETIPPLEYATQQLLDHLRYNYSISAPEPIPSSVLVIRTTYIVQVTMCNFLLACSTSSITFDVIASRAVEPIVSIFGPSRRFLYAKDSLYLGAAAYTQNCDGDVSYGNLLFVWTVVEMPTNGTANDRADLKSVSQNPAVFKLNPYTLTVGMQYSVQLNVTSLISRKSAVVSVAAIVQQGALIARIAGGDATFVQTGYSKVIDASTSFDENIPTAAAAAGTGSAAGLLFSWSCVQTAPTYSTRCPFLAVPLQGGKLNVSAPVSAPEATGLVTLTVTDIGTTRSSTVTVTVDVSLVDRPYILLSAAANTDIDHFNTNSRLQLRASLHLLEPCAAVWSVDDASVALTSGGSLTPTSKVLYPQIKDNAFNLVVASSSLPQRTQLTFTLSCGSSTSGLLVTTNGAPLPGEFTVRPAVGTELFTQFRLAATQWSDENLPLVYEFFFASLATMSNALLASASEASFTTSMLPAGNIEMGRELDCTLRVFDSLGTYSEAYAVATVLTLAEAAVASSSDDDDTAPAAANSSLAIDYTAEVLRLLRNAASVGGVDNTKRVLALSTAVLNTANCSLAPNCTATLHRESCRATDHTCGVCLLGYAGDAGDKNTPCLPYQQIQQQGNFSGVPCSRNATCDAGYYCDNYLAQCVVRSKSCHQNCSNAGKCTYSKSATGLELLSAVDCRLDDTTCEANCACFSGFSGRFCEYTDDELRTRREARTLLVSALGALTFTEDVNPNSLSSWASTLYAISQDPYQLSAADSATIVATCNATLRAARDIGLTSYDALKGVLQAVDAVAAVRAGSYNPFPFDSTNFSDTSSNRSEIPEAVTVADLLAITTQFSDLVSSSLVVGEEAALYNFNNFRLTCSAVPLPAVGANLSLAAAQTAAESAIGIPVSSFLITPNANSARAAVTSLQVKVITVLSRSYKTDTSVFDTEPIYLQLATDSGESVDNILTSMQFTLPHSEQYAATYANTTRDAFTAKSVCTGGSLKESYSYACPGSNYVINHQCVGRKGNLTTICPVLTSVCGRLSWQGDANITMVTTCTAVSATVNATICDCVFDKKKQNKERTAAVAPPPLASALWGEWNGFGANVPGVTDSDSDSDSESHSNSGYVNEPTWESHWWRHGRRILSTTTRAETTEKILDSSGATNMIASAEYVASSFGDTFDAADDFSPSDLSRVLLVVYLFASLWGAGFLILSVCIGRSHPAVKKSIAKLHFLSKEENNKVQPSNIVATDEGSVVSSTSARDTFLAYIDKVIPAVFSESKSPLHRMAAELCAHHRYITLFTLGDGQITLFHKVLILLKVLSVDTMQMFLLALLYDLESPDDDGSCEDKMTQQSCLSRSAVTDAKQTYCEWTYSESQGSYSCSYKNPDSSVKTFMFILIFISIITSLMNIPIDYLFDICGAPIRAEISTATGSQGVLGVVSTSAMVVAQGARRLSQVAGQTADRLRRSVVITRAAATATSARKKLSAVFFRKKSAEFVVANRMVSDDLVQVHSNAVAHLPRVAMQAAVLKRRSVDASNLLKGFVYSKQATLSHLLQGQSQSHNQNQNQQLDQELGQGQAQAQVQVPVADRPNSSSSSSSSSSASGNVEETRPAGNANVTTHGEVGDAVTEFFAVDTTTSNAEEEEKGVDEENPATQSALLLLCQEVVTQRTLLINGSMEAAVYDAQWGVEVLPTAHIERTAGAGGQSSSKVSPLTSFPQTYTVTLTAKRAIKAEIIASDEAAGKLKDKLSNYTVHHAGLAIIHLFMQDVLGRRTHAARIFENKFEEDFAQTAAVSRLQKALALGCVLGLNGFFIYYALLKAFVKGTAWQHTYIIACVAQMVVEIVLNETIECLWLNYTVPNLVADEVKRASVILKQVAEKLTAPKEAVFAPSGQKIEEQFKRIFFDATSFLFSSTKVAMENPSLLESMVVLSYHTHLPGEMCKMWPHYRARMTEEKRRLQDQSLKEQHSWNMFRSLVLKFIVSVGFFVVLAMQALGTLNFGLQKVVIRFIQPLLFSGLTLLCFYAAHSTVALIFVVVSGTVVVGWLAMNYCMPVRVVYGQRLGSSDEEGGGAGDPNGVLRRSARTDTGPNFALQGQEQEVGLFHKELKKYAEKRLKASQHMDISSSSGSSSIGGDSSSSNSGRSSGSEYSGVVCAADQRFTAVSPVAKKLTTNQQLYHHAAKHSEKQNDGNAYDESSGSSDESIELPASVVEKYRSASRKADKARKNAADEEAKLVDVDHNLDLNLEQGLKSPPRKGSALKAAWENSANKEESSIRNVVGGEKYMCSSTHVVPALHTPSVPASQVSDSSVSDISETVRYPSSHASNKRHTQGEATTADRSWSKPGSKSAAEAGPTSAAWGKIVSSKRWKEAAFVLSDSDSDNDCDNDSDNDNDSEGNGTSAEKYQAQRSNKKVGRLLSKPQVISCKNSSVDNVNNNFVYVATSVPSVNAAVTDHQRVDSDVASVAQSKTLFSSAGAVLTAAAFNAMDASSDSESASGGES
jgi:hypothetical protein